jgi:hypothetical protein
MYIIFKEAVLLECLECWKEHRAGDLKKKISRKCEI